MIYIYGLINPETGKVRYVGKTVAPAMRLACHRRGSGNIFKRHWHNHLKRQGLQEEMIILEKLEDDQDWQACELYWVKRLASEGNKLVNNPGDIVDALGEECDISANIWHFAEIQSNIGKTKREVYGESVTIHHVTLDGRLVEDFELIRHYYRLDRTTDVVRAAIAAAARMIRGDPQVAASKETVNDVPAS